MCARDCRQDKAGLKVRMVIKPDLNLNVHLYDLSGTFSSYCNLYENYIMIKADLSVPLDDLCDAFSSYIIFIKNVVVLKFVYPASSS